LVLFVRIGTFQWVRAIPNKKFSRSIRLAARRDARAVRDPGGTPAPAAIPASASIAFSNSEHTVPHISVFRKKMLQNFSDWERSRESDIDVRAATRRMGVAETA
jgi:hypothetical protein